MHNYVIWVCSPHSPLSPPPVLLPLDSLGSLDIWEEGRLIARRHSMATPALQSSGKKVISTKGCSLTHKTLGGNKGMYIKAEHPFYRRARGR